MRLQKPDDVESQAGLRTAYRQAEQQNDSRPRMLCLTVGIGTAADTLLEQFSRRKHGG